MEEVERMEFETGVLTSKELDRWHSALELAEEEGAFFASMTLVIVAGSKT